MTDIWGCLFVLFQCTLTLNTLKAVLKCVWREEGDAALELSQSRRRRWHYSAFHWLWSWLADVEKSRKACQRTQTPPELDKIDVRGAATENRESTKKKMNCQTLGTALNKYMRSRGQLHSLILREMQFSPSFFLPIWFIYAPPRPHTKVCFGRVAN